MHLTCDSLSSDSITYSFPNFERFCNHKHCRQSNVPLGHGYGLPTNQRKVIRGAALPTHPRICASSWNKCPCSNNYISSSNNMNNNYTSGRSLSGIVDSNSPDGMDVCLLWVLFVVEDRGLCYDRSLVQDSPTECHCVATWNNNTTHPQWFGRRWLNKEWKK